MLNICLIVELLQTIALAHNLSNLAQYVCILDIVGVFQKSLSLCKLKTAVTTNNINTAVIIVFLPSLFFIRSILSTAPAILKFDGVTISFPLPPHLYIRILS